MKNNAVTAAVRNMMLVNTLIGCYNRRVVTLVAHKVTRDSGFNGVYLGVRD